VFCFANKLGLCLFGAEEENVLRKQRSNKPKKEKRKKRIKIRT
jgi:hypothetical protein